MRCTVAGVGVDPRRPPRVWEAWNGEGWSPCTIERDETGGLNQDGDVVLHVPEDHRASRIAHQLAGWLRCRLVESLPDQSTYQAPPIVNAITAFTIGGTVQMANSEVQHNESIGISDGTPGQRFPLLRRPVLASSEPRTLTVKTPEGEQSWTEVRHFAESGPDDKHFRVDHVAGEVQLGPAVRLVDGTLRLYGAAPPRGSTITLTAYRSGGGRRGNVTAGQIRVLKTSVPYVARVENRSGAVGGSDAETLEDAKVRGPMLLRARGRAVTAEDFVELARDVAPEAARVHCAASREGDQGEGVLVLVIPHLAGDEVGRIRLADLTPEDDMLRRISDALDACRLVGTRILVAPPHYTGLTVVADVHARERFDAEEVHQEVLRALYGFLDPLTGGPDGTGWPFGRSVQAHEVHTALARIPGVDMAQELSVTLFPADPETGHRQKPVQRLDLQPNGLVFSYEHQVRVQ
jgi:predicted phage baseplate assembly protein